MILCHSATRTHFRHTDVPLPSLKDFITLYEALLAPLHPGRVVAVAMNTLELDEHAADEAMRRAAKETGLPVADPVRGGDQGCRRLAEPVLALLKRRRGRSSGRQKPTSGRKAAAKAK
jgi:uncharacterized NAD-dependent epimerase/dehydratase family protein